MKELHEVFVWFWAAAIAVILVGLGLWVWRIAKNRVATELRSAEGGVVGSEGVSIRGVVDEIHSAELPMPPLKWRMLGVTLLTVLLTVSIFYTSAHQISVMMFKQVLITQAVLLGYLADRAAFPYSRPHEFPADIRWRYEWRRMGIICAALLASAWGA